jgi:hypothetical protein
MPSIDFDSFLRALATHMAATASLQYASTPRALWVYQLVEADSTLAAVTPAPASVLRIFGGTVPLIPVATLSIQCQTTALPGDDQSGMTRAQALHGTLLDSTSGRPLRMKALTGWRINAIQSLQTPAQIGRDEKERALIVFDFDAEIVATA